MTDANTSDSNPLDVATAYLVDLYGEHPKGLLWIGGHADGFKGRTFSEPIEAARYALRLDGQGGAGVYHRCTTLAVQPHRRGAAADSATVHYFALDVDIAGPGHKAENLPAGLDDAAVLIKAAGFPEPSRWIASGGGYYPQWRFAEPIDVRGQQERDWVADAFATISAHFIAVAKGFGWHLDNVRDLARVFRMPGTTNRKVSGREDECRVIRQAGPTHDLGVLASIARRAGKPREIAPSAASTGDEVAELFDNAGPDERRFTEEQAKDFIRTEREKLAATEPGGYNAAINQFAMACAHFPWLVSRKGCGAHVIKALGPKTGWTAPDADDERTIDSAYRATEAGKSWVAVRVDSAPAAGGEITGGTLPPPSRPLEVAQALAQRLPASADGVHLAWWRDDFYRWTGAHWEVRERPEIEQWIYQQTGEATFLVPKKSKEKDAKPEFESEPWAPTKFKIANVLHALGVGELQRIGEEDRGVLAAANGVVERRKLLAHTPKRFNLFSLPFDYEPDATAPAWNAFLDQVLPDDQEAQDFLGEWFGYVLSGRTDQQKMAALIGKKRSGKGTIARILAALIGKENVSGLNLNTLGSTFGLEPFVGAALAVASDVRWHSRNIGDAVQILLEVSGEDHVTVHRKNRAAWKGRLGVRFMLMSNDTPTFSDRSGALVDRMLYVSFRQSFFGREDVGLTDKLMHELPGILNWALDGLDRLDSRGRFTQPESGRAEAESTRRLADPIGSFIEDWCDVGPEHSIALDHLYLKYQDWCVAEGRTKDSTTKEIFSRDVRSKVDGLISKRFKEGGKFKTLLQGIGSDAL